MALPALLTVKEFASLCRYHENSVYRMIRLGHLTVERIGHRTIRIPLPIALRLRRERVDPFPDDPSISAH